MKIDMANTTITESNVLDIEEVEMKFSESALPHLTRMFVNLYNNPDEAVYREILFNAIDATKKSGSSEKVEVYLPTSDTPVLTIVDKGVGMSLEDLKRNCQFGGTDKNEENDSVGGFGLGFKSPLSITSQFSVESIKNGERTVVTISNSEDGICRMSVLLKEETELPNGTTVSVPVKNVHLMREVAEKYSEYAPQIITYFNRHDYPRFQEKSHYTNLTKVFDGFYETSGYYDREMVLVMGGVPYTVPYNDLYFHIPELRDLLKTKYILEAPIDAITLSPNREGIQFNQKTKDTIKELLFDKLLEYVEECKKFLEDSETYLEAYDKYLKNAIRSFIGAGDAKWNGVSIGFINILLGYWETDEEDMYGRKFKKKNNYTLTEVTDSLTKNSEYSVKLENKKIIFVEPHEDIKNSRSTYLIRQYFDKNEISFEETTVFRTRGSISEYTTTENLVLADKNDQGVTTLVGALDFLKQDYEVISILEMKNDLVGWKSKKKVGVEAKPKVKYLEREVKFLHDNSGTLEYSKKTIGDIVGEGSKKLGIYESKANKDEYVTLSYFETEVFKKFVETTHGMSDIEGVIILRNNSKPEVLVNNTEKFGNEYVVIVDFYSITKFADIGRVEEILSQDLSLMSLIDSWRFNYIEDMDAGVKNIKDTDLREILDNGVEKISVDDSNFLNKIRVRDSQRLIELLVEFSTSKVGLDKDFSEEFISQNNYSSVRNILSSLVEESLRQALKKYPLNKRDNPTETLEYMNIMFDHKYSK